MEKSCYLFGSKSLLVQCCKILKDNGFIVRAIVSDDADIRQWSSSQNIISLATHALNELKELGSVDYIFSITHLKIIPEDILKLALHKAINFHDGLLPGYAGLNVTSWAIFNGEKQHGVSWHEMTKNVDQGDVIKQIKFDVDPNETALTLNAKCYESAISSFSELVQDINSGNLFQVPQPAFASLIFKRTQRMPVMAVLNWSKTAKQLDAMVRALNFGKYANPLNLAKLLLNNKVYYVLETEIVDLPYYSPGKIVAIGPYLDIATSDQVLRIKKLLDQHGKELPIEKTIVDEGYRLNETLPSVAPELASVLQNIDENSVLHEAKWLKILEENNQLSIPLARTVNLQQNETGYEISTQFLENVLSEEFDLKSLLILFFARMCAQEKFSIFLQNKISDEILPFFDACLPIEFSLDFQQSGIQLLTQCQVTLRKLRDLPGYSRDLLIRNAQQLPHAPQRKIVITPNHKDIMYGTDAELNIAINVNDNSLTWQYDNNTYHSDDILQLQYLFTVFVDNLVENATTAFSDITLLSQADYQKIICDWNDTQTDYDESLCIHTIIENQVAETPDAIAVSHLGQTWTYSELNERSNAIAHALISYNIKPDQRIGILLDRSLDMVAALLGVLKAGAAYLPLDPTYPLDRIQYMLEDGSVAAVISESEHKNQLQSLSVPILYLDNEQSTLALMPTVNPAVQVNQDNLAYTIYTSGSTGLPKGVMVEHGNVVNFFHAMNKHVSYRNGVWLAVTSISFDISVLEIFWSLANGFEVAIYSDAKQKPAQSLATRFPEKPMQFSLFYWNVANGKTDAYELLLESAKFADQNQFEAVWTPERHFHSFGGYFPNPAITSAALATSTKNVKIRAGSCVLPLHHPIRVAEDWSMIDNLSNGRAGMAIASGWQPNDFVIMPQNHANAKDIMFESLEQVKKLWAGETLTFDGPGGKSVEVSTLPRPIQKELPCWVTAAGNPETFRKAGEIGAGVLTHMLGQSKDDIAKNIKIYREAYKQAGHEGEGHITLMLHTLVGPDNEKVKDLARGPMKTYLKSAMFLVKNAAWHFPTFKQLSDDTGQTLDEFFESITEEDMDSLLEFAFQRYFNTSGLFGTPEHCLSIVDALKEIGVNEIACLIDYGLEKSTVISHLPYLNTLRKLANMEQTDKVVDDTQSWTLAETIAKRQVTHLQCTPSMANMMLADNETAAQMKNISHILLGGEPLSVSLAKKIVAWENTKLSNMYGPTETTVWSSTRNITAQDNKIYIGKPISNTEIYVLDKFHKPVPDNFPGEIFISGKGVTQGYLGKPKLNREKFIENPFESMNSPPMYATGDIGKFTRRGILEYIGRLDHQVKIRGYRIELGEIEFLLKQSATVKDALVVIKENSPNDKYLIAYIIPHQKLHFNKQDTKNKLKKMLPDFMVPRHIVTIDTFPLTSNGKIDRKALPAPVVTLEQTSPTPVKKPDSPLQEKILTIWKKSLGITQIGMDDNFFDIGGHSLLVVDVIAQVRSTLNKSVKITDMFRFPTIRTFSDYLSLPEDESSTQNTNQNRANSRVLARKAALNRRQTRITKETSLQDAE